MHVEQGEKGDQPDTGTAHERLVLHPVDSQDAAIGGGDNRQGIVGSMPWGIPEKEEAKPCQRKQGRGDATVPATQQERQRGEEADERQSFANSAGYRWNGKGPLNRPDASARGRWVGVDCSGQRDGVPAPSERSSAGISRQHQVQKLYSSRCNRSSEQLAIGNWQLAIGNWQLAIGRLLA